VLKTDVGKQAVPDLACVNARGQKVVGGLIILVAQSTVGVWLEPMAHPALRRPEAAMQEPEEEFHLRRGGRS
jgi:hypothetical protein